MFLAEAVEVHPSLLIIGNVMPTKTLILLALAGITLAFFAIPKLQASPRWSGQSGSITPIIGY